MSESKNENNGNIDDDDDDDDDEYLEDKLVLTIGDVDDDRRCSEYISPSKKELDLGLGLDLSRAEGRSYKDDSSNGIQEDTITVVFDLPDGSQDEANFKLGQTVEFIKSYIESEYGIPMLSQTLFLEDKPMLDPLSLLDYPEAKGVDEIYIVIKGDMPRESKK